MMREAMVVRVITVPKMRVRVRDEDDNGKKR